MAKKEITSRPGLFGTTQHYDSRGRKVGESRLGLFGSVNHYDAKGRKVGSMTGSFGNTTHWDEKGHRIGSSQSGAFTTDHYNSKGQRIANIGFFAVDRLAIIADAGQAYRCGHGIGHTVTLDFSVDSVTSGTCNV